MSCQVILLAGGIGERLYPLTHSTPKAVLPIALRPMLALSIEGLVEAGLKVATKEEFYSQTVHIVQREQEKFGSSVKVTVFMSKDYEKGSAHVITELDSLIKTEFFVISVGLMLNTDLDGMITTHIMNNSAATIMFSQTGENLAPGAQDFVALEASKNRVVHMVPVADVEGDLQLRKEILRLFPNVLVRRDLVDCHCYLFAPWVVEHLKANKEFDSIKHDLLPSLIDMQFPSGSTNLPFETKSAYQMSHDDSVSRVCFSSFITPSKKRSLRVNTINSYFQIHNEFIHVFRYPIHLPRSADHKSFVHETSQNQTSTANIGTSCIVGENLEIGEFSTINRTVIGRGCVIGTGVKLENCIVMDKVVIEDKCRLDHCVICSNSTVRQNCRLSRCEIGQKAIVDEDTLQSNEKYVEDGLFEDF